VAVPAYAQKKTVASRIERSLAGVKLGTRISALMRSPTFNNPTQITVGGVSGSAAGDTGGLTAGGFGTGTGMTPGSPFPVAGSPFPGGSQPSPFLSAGPSPMPGMPSGMALPSIGGGAFPGMGSPDTGSTDQAGALAMTYLYRSFRGIKGFTLEIQADEDGRVVQLVGTSLAPCGVYTARGIGFGSSYARVIQAYGWPESQVMNGEFLQMSYQEKAHVAFQLLNKKVARIVVAEVG
jgi:hypothetical protein